MPGVEVALQAVRRCKCPKPVRIRNALLVRVFTASNAIPSEMGKSAKSDKQWSRETFAMLER